MKRYIRPILFGIILLVMTSSAAITPPSSAQGNSLPKREVVRLKQRLLAMINQQRRAAGLRDVELDEFASRVAERHCEEMMQSGFTSHWNQEGWKPYMRFSQAGGYDAVMENVAGKWSNSGIDAANVPEIIESMHLAMYNERPPHDSHRRTILQPQHTHVGIAITYNDGRVQFAEEFVARYIEIKPIPRRIKSGEVLTLSGELLFNQTDIYNINIFYEPFPRKLAVDELNRTGDYGFPKDKLVLRPKLSDGFSYQDGSSGVINYDRNSGKFTTPIDFKGAQPGIYTIVIFVDNDGYKFPATNICVEVK